MTWFTDKHAVVTGGGTGIGKAIAAVLKDKGAKVTIVARNESRLREAADNLAVSYAVADVTDRDSVNTAMRTAADALGPVDILVNNAGAVEAAPFHKMSDDYWDRCLAVNLTGVYNCSKAVISSMLKNDGGRIVNIASTAALNGYAYVAAYCAAKHGVVGLTRAMALEYAQKNITVNAVCPGYTDTDIVDSALDNIAATTGRSREEALAEIVKSNPQRRLIQPEEVADTVIWLCRQPSMNGQSIAVAGGEVL